jgi:ABC-2 type transport system ATP-binding protein
LPIAPDSAVPPPAADASPPALLIDRVRHAFGDRVALDDVSFRVAPGELFALLGPNGGGKTTLFRVIATMLRPAGGVVCVFGANVIHEASRVRRLMGVVFQAPALDKRLTVRENLHHHGHLYGLRGAALRARAADVLGVVQMADRAADLVSALSGGLARRAEIAKSLLPSPRFLLLDEPTTGLDPGVRDDLWRVLRTLRDASGTTIVLTTHLMDEAAACDRVAILDRGRIVVAGRPTDLTHALGGEVISIESDDLAGLAADVHARFGVRAAAVAGVVRLEHDRAHELVGALIDAYGRRIRAMHLSRPTLHDVFVHHTGRRFD